MSISISKSLRQQNNVRVFNGEALRQRIARSYEMLSRVLTISYRFQQATAKRQRHAHVMVDTRQLAELKQKIAEFEQREGDLPGRIVAHDLNLLLILNARRMYEKLHRQDLDKLEEIQLFETVTADLIRDHMTEYLKRHPQSTLTAINHEEAEVKALFLRIFELDTVARNRLVVCISERRTLHDELHRLI